MADILSLIMHLTKIMGGNGHEMEKKTSAKTQQRF